MIGDIFAYMAVIWFFVSMFLNKELSGRFSLHQLIALAVFSRLSEQPFSSGLTHYGIIGSSFPSPFLEGRLAWVNLGALLSLRAAEDMQGRALGAGGAMWSLGQIIAPLAAGPLAGWNIYSPLLVGAALLMIAFFYFLGTYKPRMGN